MATKCKTAKTLNGQISRLRGQAAVELLAYWAFFFLVFIVTLAYVITSSQQELSTRQYELASQRAAEIGGYADYASRAGDGFSGTFPLEANIMGNPYTATFKQSGSLYVEWVSPTGAPQVVVQPIITSAISGAGANGVPIDPSKGKVTIENHGGELKFIQ